MKEHPTEILLTMKKRPRHSPIMGQVIVHKPYKIPSRKSHSKAQSSRLQRSAATTMGTPDSDDEAFEKPFKTQMKGPVYQLLPRKPKFPVRRRATISGASPTTTQPPIRIEDLVPSTAARAARKEQLGRSTSQELSKDLPKLSPCLPKVPLDVKDANVPSPSLKLKQVPTNVMNNNLYNSTQDHKQSSLTNCNSQVPYQQPYAKVQPLPAMERRLVHTGQQQLGQQNNNPETIPKQLMNSSLKAIYDLVSGENGVQDSGSAGCGGVPVDRSCKPAPPARPSCQNVGVVIPRLPNSLLQQHNQVLQQKMLQQQIQMEPVNLIDAGSKQESALKQVQELRPGMGLGPACGGLGAGDVDAPPPSLPPRTGLNARLSSASFSQPKGIARH